MTVVINLLCVKTGLLEMKEWRLDEMKKFAVIVLKCQCQFILFITGSSPHFGRVTVLKYGCLAKSRSCNAAGLQVNSSLWKCGYGERFRNGKCCNRTTAHSMLLQASFTFQALLGLAVALGGSILYSSADPYYDMSAYCIMVLWVLVNIGGALYDKQITVEVEQTPVGCSCYKNLLGLPVLLLAATLTGETNKLAGALSTMPMVMWPQVAMSGFLGFGMSLCYSTLNKITSATNITAANTFNKILTTIIGSKLFHESTSIG